MFYRYVLDKHHLKNNKNEKNPFKLRKQLHVVLITAQNITNKEYNLAFLYFI
jgi:hypothetical protein